MSGMLNVAGWGPADWVVVCVVGGKLIEIALHVLWAALSGVLGLIAWGGEKVFRLGKQGAPSGDDREPMGQEWSA